jgi:hypothetical protein
VTAAGFEGFVALAQAVVEREAAAHAEDRWWILEPLVVLEGAAVAAEPLERLPAAQRALLAGDVGALPEVTGARRVALALHVDLAEGDDVHAAILLVIVTPLLRAVRAARVERTELGTPRLGPWAPTGLAEDEIAVALRRLAG